MKKIVYPGLLATVLMAVPYLSNAQKLPATQQISLHAPADVKIDGKATEWNNQFQAFNKATEVYYIMANDADNLYLTVRATDAVMVDKILSGGITFSIKSNDKKTPPATLTFPVIAAPSRVSIVNKIKNPQTNMDSELAGINNQLTIASKQIKVAGISAITDTMASVDNNYGLKIAHQINNSRAYTYELAVPLKFLQVFINTGQLKYNIKLNGKSEKITNIKLNHQDADINSPRVAEIMAKLGENRNSPFSNDLVSPTDFSGTYILSK
jgi:hypothetical protein